jgi:uncharacterized protein YecT (DUF1311 family)
MQRLNPTVLALIGGLVILLLLIAYFASNRNPDQDKLMGPEMNQAQASNPEKKCGSPGTYDLIKRELFRSAAQLRGSDQAAYDKLAAYAVLRMENPVMESQDQATGAINCSGSLSLDLPPGVEVVGGRRTLMSDVDYTIQPAADASGDVVLLKNADAIIAPLATLVRISERQQPPVETNELAPAEPDQNVATTQSANVQPGPASNAPGRPSFDCGNAHTKGEIAVCADSGLSALDVTMANQYRRALASASPEQRSALQSTRDRFLAYRDRCPNRQCIGDAYVGRMREIRDIMEGRWQPPR